MNKERAKEILNKYYNDSYEDFGVLGGKYLFNWCEEYKNFVSSGVACCVSSEWDYMIKKSFEDSESPCSYEDLDLFSIDNFLDRLEYEFNDADEEIKQDIINLIKEGLKTFEDIKYYIENNMDKEEVKTLCYDLESLINIDVHECETEVYEWWIVQDDLKYWLEQEEQIFLNGAWGRQSSGQRISQDYCVIHAFINMLQERYNLSEEDFKI